MDVWRTQGQLEQNYYQTRAKGLTLTIRDNLSERAHTNVK